MKLVVSLLLCFLVGALAANDHKHEPFGDDVVQAIEEKLSRALEKIKMPINRSYLPEEKIREDETENGDKVRIGFRPHNVSMEDVMGDWEITCPNENQLKMKIELSQSSMRIHGTVVSTLTNLETEREIDIKPAVVEWKKQISLNVNMTVNLNDGKLSIEDLQSEVNAPKPEVKLESEAPTQKDLEDDIAREFHEQLLGICKDIVRESSIREQLHDVLVQVESKRHRGEQSQQQSN